MPFQHNFTYMKLLLYTVHVFCIILYYSYIAHDDAPKGRPLDVDTPSDIGNYSYFQV